MLLTGKADRLWAVSSSVVIITATEHFTPASAFPEERPSDDQSRGSRVLCTDYECSVLCLVAVWFLVFLQELLKEGCYRETIAHFYATPGQGPNQLLFDDWLITLHWYKISG